MRRLTLLTAGLACAIAALAGANLPDPDRSAPSEGHLPPVSFDFAALEQNRPWTKPVRKNGALRLVIRPYRSGPADLLVDVQVWNTSDDPQFIVPINPFYYPVQFRDAEGRQVDLPYRIAVPDLRLFRKSGVTRLGAANHLGATYLFPRFYTRVKQSRGIECQVQGIVGYDEEEDPTCPPRVVQLTLSSDWVQVAPSGPT